MYDINSIRQVTIEISVGNGNLVEFFAESVCVQDVGGVWQDCTECYRLLLFATVRGTGQANDRYCHCGFDTFDVDSGFIKSFRIDGPCWIRSENAGVQVNEILAACWRLQAQGVSRGLAQHVTLMPQAPI